ncbi:sulfite oxidase heme-binding subunit YedZ [Orrella daihaiensis]|nr:protein-methionine-sulfoxide reductase heme-binding subunit MsrQ [Orrella daihaiensis]
MYPLLRWFYLGLTDGLTVNPTEFLTRSSGTWTLVCLMATLLVSPLRDWLNEPALIRLRRMCGLFTFFYATLHLLAWAWWEQNFVLADMGLDIVKRPFVTVGVVAFLVMLGMALTSSHRAMVAMGRYWKALHRWIYLVAVLSIIHYWLHKAGKNDFLEVTIYGLVLAALLGWRLWRYCRPKRAGFK